MQEQQGFAAFLFDMDGTLTNSVAAAERVWARWAQGKGLDVAAFLPTIHGVRCIDTIRRLNLPGVDPETEAALLTQAEIDDVEGVTAIDGAARFLASLPAGRWAVVTSAPRRLAERRLQAAGLPLPKIMVAAEDVSRGKPAPDPFLVAAKRLGVEPTDCLVFEDAPAGIAAAQAAGAKVMVVTATHSHVMPTEHSTLNSYEAYSASADELGRLHIRRH